MHFPLYHSGCNILDSWGKKCENTVKWTTVIVTVKDEVTLATIVVMEIAGR